MDTHDVTVTRHHFDPSHGAWDAAGHIERFGLELPWTARRAEGTAKWDIALPSEPVPREESDLYDIVSEGPAPRARIAAALERAPLG